MLYFFKFQNVFHMYMKFNLDDVASRWLKYLNVVYNA